MKGDELMGKKEFGKIIAPVDGSKTAKKAIFLAKSTGIKAVAMHVVNTPMSRVTAPGALFGFEYYTQLHELL